MGRAAVDHVLRAAVERHPARAAVGGADHLVVVDDERPGPVVAGQRRRRRAHRFSAGGILFESRLIRRSKLEIHSRNIFFFEIVFLGALLSSQYVRRNI